MNAAPTEAQLAEAYELGKQAAENVATWTVDPNNYDPEAIRLTLKMFDDGDPRVDEFLPAYPTLSGEWAGDPTPQSLAADILGADWETRGNNAPDFIPTDAVDALADEWLRGVDENFYEACEAELRRWVS